MKITTVDSHTEGEPTRVIVDGFPDLGGGTVAEQLAVMRDKFDHLRSAVVNEPRGADFLVGALLCKPAHPDASVGVIFFNNVGYLNACGHGTLGVAATLAHLGRLSPGTHRIETPVGLVTIRLDENGSTSIDNVPSLRAFSHVPVTFLWRGEERTVYGDIAWGGNWFFLAHEHGLRVSLDNLEELTDYAWTLRKALDEQQITGTRSLAGGIIDHIELFGPPTRSDCQSKNFVLCPGKAYDRSPCGTGTSAKLACLFAEGIIKEGEPWGQESIIGSRFVGSVRIEGGKIIPSISGRAFVTAESRLVLHDDDPFRFGIRP
jgi:4-hydroxyproline epimerase